MCHNAHNKKTNIELIVTSKIRSYEYKTVGLESFHVNRWHCYGTHDELSGKRAISKLNCIVQSHNKILISVGFAAIKVYVLRTWPCMDVVYKIIVHLKTI